MKILALLVLVLVSVCMESEVTQLCSSQFSVISYDETPPTFLHSNVVKSDGSLSGFCNANLGTNDGTLDLGIVWGCEEWIINTGMNDSIVASVITENEKFESTCSFLFTDVDTKSTESKVPNEPVVMDNSDVSCGCGYSLSQVDEGNSLRITVIASLDAEPEIPVGSCSCMLSVPNEKYELKEMGFNTCDDSAWLIWPGNFTYSISNLVSAPKTCFLFLDMVKK